MSIPEFGSGSPLDGLADKYGRRWGAPDEMGWSFEQSAFRDFCEEFAAAIRAAAAAPSTKPPPSQCGNCDDAGWEWEHGLGGESWKVPCRRWCEVGQQWAEDR